MAIATLVGSVVLWATVHSWLASLRMKDWIRGAIGERGMRAYRFAYNFLAAVSFLPILLLMRILPDHVLYFVGTPWRYFMIAGEATAGLSLLSALLQTDALSFVGLRQFIQAEAPARLVTTGFYRWVRHPLYLFGLLFLWLTPIMTSNMLVVYASLTAYIIVGALLEERRLLYEYGTAYAE